MKTNLSKVKWVDQAPPFDGQWNFVVVKTANQTPEQDYYGCHANHDQIPGSGDGFGYQTGRNQGFFSAGLGDVPLPLATPVGWWAYQHNFVISPATKLFKAKFEVLAIDFDNTSAGYDDGGSAQVWASIMQCQIDPSKGLNDYPVLDAAIVPVPLNFTGEVNVHFEAKTSAELNISNPSEEYAFRMGWIIQITYQNSQNPHIELSSFFRNFSNSQVLKPSDVVSDVLPPEREKLGSTEMSFDKLPKGFVVGGKIVGVK